MRRSAVVLAVLLAATTLAPAPVTAAPVTADAVTADAGTAAVADGRGGAVGLQVVLGPVHRPTGMGMPTTPDPRRHIAAATVSLAAHGPAGAARQYPSASVRLARAAGSERFSVYLGLGHAEGAVCAIDESTLIGTETSPGRAEYRVYGSADGLPAPAAPYDCAAVATAPTGSDYYHDLVAGRLAPADLKPSLAVGPVRLLGRAQARLRLVPGVRTGVTVTVRNTGPAVASGVRLRSRGPRLRSSGARVGSLAPGESTTVDLRVRLRGQRATRLRVLAAGAVRAVRRVRVAAAPAPMRPRAGRYRSADRAVAFRVRGSRVVGWRATVAARCGGGSTLRFPSVRVPRNGIVQARRAGAQMTRHLEMAIVGGKVTRGRFVVERPSGCVQEIRFTARRS